MSGTGGMMLDLPYERYNNFNAQNRTPDRIYGQPQMGMPGGPNGEISFGDPIDYPNEMDFIQASERQMNTIGIAPPNPIDQPIFGFEPGNWSGPDIDLPPVFEPNPGGGGGSKGGFPPPSVGIDPSPIQGGGGGGGNGPGLDHLKDYGPVVEQMKQYVQSMSGLIDQINSKF